MRILWILLWLFVLWTIIKMLMRFYFSYIYRKKMQNKEKRKIIDIDYEEIKDEPKSKINRGNE